MGMNSLMIIIFVGISMMISIICNWNMKDKTKLIMDHGTKGQTGEEAVRQFFQEQDQRIEIRYAKESMFDYYDIKEETMNLCALSKNSFSAYFYCNALRQAVFGSETKKHRKLYALKTALLMLFRMTGPTILFCMIAWIISQKMAFLIAIGVEAAIFLIYQMINTGIEHEITKKAMNFIREHEVMDQREEEIAKKFYRSIEFAEWATLWKGISTVISLIPEILKNLRKMRGGVQIEQ